MYRRKKVIFTSIINCTQRNFFFIYRNYHLSSNKVLDFVHFIKYLVLFSQFYDNLKYILYKYI